MTPDPTLTDEELAAEERGHVRHRASEGHHDFCRRCSFAWPCPTSRLIAALRAEREQLKKWEELVPLVDCIDGLRAELRTIRAESLKLAERLVAEGHWGEEKLEDWKRNNGLQ